MALRDASPEQREGAADNLVLVHKVSSEDSLPEEQITDSGTSKLTERRRTVLLVSFLALAAAGCAALAALAAGSAAGAEGEPLAEASPAAAPLGGAEVRPATSARRLGEGSQVNVGECQAPLEGSNCQRNVKWSMEHGIHEHPDWYPHLSPSSSFEYFQHALHSDPYALCPRPCGVDTLLPQTNTSAPVVGWNPSGRVVSQGQWCAASEPQPDWSLRSGAGGQGVEVKVLTYNLFWWNLFKLRKGNGGSAGTLIAGAGNPQKFDVMGFQECEDITQVLEDAGLAQDYGALFGPHAMCMAFNKAAWDLLDDGADDVGEDRSDQWYGTRAGMWARLQHKQTRQTLFFVNHHGPLPVHSGGKCGGEATAYNLLKLIANKAQHDDGIILVGDFNSGPDSMTVQKLRQRLHSIYTGTSFGGVDHVLSSCPDVIATRNLGSGGSDHDALEVRLRI